MHNVEEGDQTREEAKELRLFAKEFGQGVRQQRVRGKTQEKAGTLPLAISMMKRIIAPQTQSLNTFEELQGFDEKRGDHLVTGTSVENYSRPAKLIERKGDRDLEREIKNNGDIFLLEEHENFVTAVTK